ncbi:glycerol-3-phosphate acyltransferase 1, mitochondrial-like isoform X2 [Macrobrachium nipponense]|uniref:glycerol-3-phosphate acyltransferase 1, mitochondrial-like isoform X2 n=1 Tax=Macrobrachium nipponense TaxID=159736 RepID=UPI0030C87E77
MEIITDKNALGLSWRQLDSPTKAYTTMTIPNTATTVTIPSVATKVTGAPEPLSTMWGSTAGHPLAPEIAASTMPTPPESPLPGCLSEIKSNNGLIADTTTKIGLRNILQVSTSNPDRYCLTRKCCYIFHCMNLKTNFNYPDIPNKMILQDDRVVVAMEQTVCEEMEEKGLDPDDNKKAFSTLLAQHTSRVHRLLKEMKAAISTTLIRLTGYVLFKVFSNLLMSITIHGGQQEVIERAIKRDTPMIFVPLHRSHVDYLFVTWVLFNQQIPAPIVAAGDNLRIPVFGWLLRGLGGFFIKRRLESSKSRKDLLYRAVLQTYVTHALQAGYNLEFFIEGGRTRTGKPCMPKGGLLSVIVDAYMNGTLDDALIVPIAINYDKLLDGNFIREQMGQSKVPESFWGAVRAIIKVLSTNYGHARIDFGQPFSLREFVQSSKAAPPLLTPNLPHSQLILECTPPLSPSQLSLSPPSSSGDIQEVPSLTNISSTAGKGHHRSLSSPVANNHKVIRKSLSNPSNSIHAVNKLSNRLQGARSNSSLFGTEVTDEYRSLIKSLAAHIVYDAERCQAIMSTNVVAWLLSFVYRNGATLTTLTKAVDGLRESFRARERDTGFSGLSKDVVKHAIKMLGAGLVRVEACPVSSSFDEIKEYLVKPITLLPNIIELNYYASAVTPLFAVDAVVATSLNCLLDRDLWSYKDCSPDILVNREKIVKKATRLCEILQNEYLFAPPCASLEAKIHHSIDNLVVMGLLVDAGRAGSQWSNESDDDDITFSQTYRVAPSTSCLEVIQAWINMLVPMIDAYYCTVYSLRTLVNKQVPDKEFLQSTQSHIQDMLERGLVTYGESICIDPLRNAVKLLETLSVVESYSHSNIRVLYLSRDYDSEDQLAPLLAEMNSYRS